MVQISQNVIDISTNPTTSTDVVTKGYVDGYLSDYSPTVGIERNITPILLSPGGTTANIWSVSVDGYSDVSAVAELRCSADDGYTGKRLSGPLVCTAKRYKDTLLDITSQQAASPWICTDPLWLPQFDVDGNNLVLQLVPDSTSTIQVRGFVKYEITNTSQDVPPPLHTSDWLLTQIQYAIGSKLLGLVVPEDFTISGSDVITATTKYGSSLSTRAAKAQAVVVGTRRHLQFLLNSSNTIYNASYGAIKEAVYVLNTPSLPFSGGDSGFAINTNDYNFNFGQAAAGTSTFVTSVATCYVNGISTHTLNTGVQILAVSWPANTTAGIEIGGLNSFGAFGFIGGTLGSMVYCNAALSSGERNAVIAALTTYQAGD
jgi:hypothetical protein